MISKFEPEGNERGSSSRNCLRIYDRHLSISLYQIIRTIWLFWYFGFKATFHIWTIYFPTMQTNIYQGYQKKSHLYLYFTFTCLCLLWTIGIYLYLKIKIMSMVLKHISNVLIKGVGYEDRRRSGATRPAHIFCLDPKGDARISR